MANVVLIYPRTHHQQNYPTFWLPYSVLSVGSALKHKGHNVTIVDNNLLNSNDSQNILSMNLDNIDLVGISSMVGHQITEAIEIADFVKSRRRDIPVVVGGAFPTMMPEVILSHSSFDVAAIGQGEITLCELLDVRDSRDFTGIKGIAYHNKTGLQTNPKRSITSRSNFPPFDFTLVPNVENYIQADPKINTVTLNYITSQGCPFDCGFCSDTNLFDGKYSRDSLERVLDDVEFLIQQYGINGIKFYDSNFFVGRKFPSEFAKSVLERQYQIKWAGAVHPKTFLDFDETYLSLISKSGCSRLLIGAESGSKEVLDLVGKSLHPDDMIVIAKKAAEYNISVSFTMIVGFPGVSDRHYDETFALGMKLRELSDNHEVKIHIYAPYPMTSLYPIAIQHGFKAPETIRDWGNYDYYNTQTLWVPQEMESRVREFNLRNSTAVWRV